MPRHAALRPARPRIPSPKATLAAYGGRPVLSPERIARWPAPSLDHVSALIEAARSGRYHRVNHPIVSQLEDALGQWSGGLKVRAVGSGTAAIHIALDYLREHGPKILTPALNWPGALGPIHFAGLEPVFADVSLEDGCIDENEALAKLSPEIGVLLLSHLFGNVSEVPRLRQTARTLDIAIVDDCAQAIGAVRPQPDAGRIDSDAFTLSGNGAKHLGAGELGFLCGTNGGLIEHVDRVSLSSSARDGGRVFAPMSYGLNYRPNVLSAAVALSRLPGLDEQLAARAENAAILRIGLSGLPGLRILHRFTEARNSYLNFALLLEAGELGLPAVPATRDFIVDLLLQEGVPVWIWLRRPAWAYLPFWPEEAERPPLPNTEKLLAGLFDIVEIAPPNGSDVMRAYIAAFEKVWTALPELAPDIRKAAGDSDGRIQAGRG
ncbi:DegT/DnrJ/EryC1/StrS family aminotransferase [Inquilinus sp. Marseille-Q2685]|uniref:DegT/DnrJ/EryC1/StrS family aminotransferase n=1 Tax=Inquilinus sp. Marseille-Q2685 TaxID=2866581 RepID=UPI001CE4AEAE|nr:DegT/DnrJ/EryC1/StrS family aminotransferase [Inquilinus sp. Marseille-Q2685]